MPVRVCVRACAQNLNRALRLILKSQMSHIHMYECVCGECEECTVSRVKNATRGGIKSSRYQTILFYFIFFHPFLPFISSAATVFWWNVVVATHHPDFESPYPR